jgi:hypothetical protein
LPHSQVSDEARGADFGLVLVKTDEQGRPKFKEDDPEVLVLVLAETINAGRLLPPPRSTIHFSLFRSSEKIPEDDSDHSHARAPLSTETTRMQTEGVWAASGWYYEGQYALLVYRWAEKRYPHHARHKMMSE